jgi:hypothetical protein
MPKLRELQTSFIKFPLFQMKKVQCTARKISCLFYDSLLMHLTKRLLFSCKVVVFSLSLSSENVAKQL